MTDRESDNDHDLGFTTWDVLLMMAHIPLLRPMRFVCPWFDDIVTGERVNRYQDTRTGVYYIATSARSRFRLKSAWQTETPFIGDAETVLAGLRARDIEPSMTSDELHQLMRGD